MCKTTKEVWHTLIITHQGSSQVKNSKIDLLTQEYEFSISNEETIDNGFTRFKAIRAKVTVIEEAKDLATLPLNELVENLKVYEMILENDGLVSKTTTKDKVKSIALKANITRGQTSNKSTCQDESNEDEEINLMAKNFKKLSRKGVNIHDKFKICKVKTKGGESSRRERGCYNYGDNNHLTDNCPKSNNKAFIKVNWSDSEDGDEPRNDATCLMAIDSQEVRCENDSLKDHHITNYGCTNHNNVYRRPLYSYPLNQDKHIIPKSEFFNLGNILPTSKN
ncbi:hypothetical protein Tco_1105091 [Tanacetum coccineum]